MCTFKNIMLVLLVLAVLAAVCLGVVARVRERAISQIKPGMHKRAVESLLGLGQPDIMSPACENCPDAREQLTYRGNPSLWYGRLEDTLVICYTNEVVCDTSRVGL